MLVKEIKFVTHLSRNIYLYFTLFITLNLIFSFSIPLQTFIAGLITMFIAYAPVYFLNDYADKKEDIQYKKANLYIQINNKNIFWIITIVLVLGGIVSSYLLTKESLVPLLIMYILNYFYSFEPFRLRNKFLLREITIFIVYVIKWYYVASLIHFPLLQSPLSVVVMAGSTAALSVSMYKRYMKRNKVAEYLFVVLFAASWLATILLYKQVFFLFFPLMLVVGFLYLRYRNEQIPIGQYQTLYFIYSILIWLLQAHFR